MCYLSQRTQTELGAFTSLLFFSKQQLVVMYQVTSPEI